MPGDYTRFTFDPFEDHFGVLMQQGRVLLDADFNELVALLDRQLRVRTLDTIGGCVVPMETPEGFHIQLGGASITIGPGRAYVHGFLAENHGAEPLEFHRRLEEMRGTAPVAYEDQPYLPNAATAFPFPQEGGPHLVYLDVWRRELTHLEEPDLLEKAVGVDTATRTQVVWQVRVLADLPQGTTCASPDDALPAWVALTAPSAGRLTTSAVGAPSSEDPCIVDPAGGYRGYENRLYRVEVHDAGVAGVATFKWSRDNASVAAAVTGMGGGLDELTVSRLGRDNVRRLAPADWIEVLDDHLELAGQPGVMRKIQSIDEVNRTVTLDAALPAGVFDQANPGSRHTRVRRWDEKGPVLDAASAVIADVDANGGVIPVSAGGGTMVLEDGVQVAFSESPAGGAYRTGDYWVFSARTVDASVEELVAEPPRGIHHHYCRLAVVRLPDQVDDCRTFWPPELGGEDCYCTECVSAESHNSGAFTIQMAIDRVRSSGGKVCLGPGIFFLGNAPVELHGAQSVQVVGHGWRTILLYQGDGAAVSVASSVGVDLESFSVVSLAIETANAAVMIQNSALVRVERTILAQVGFRDRGGPAIGLTGFLLEVKLRDNVLVGDAGVQSFATGVDEKVFATTSLAGSRSYTLALGLHIEDNLIAAGARGVALDRFTFHLGETTIARNSVYGARQVGIATLGLVVPNLTSSRIDIVGNELLATGFGVVLGTDDTRVMDNDIGVLQALRDQKAGGPERHGILVLDDLLQRGVERCQILANRVIGLSGDGVHVQAHVVSAMIKDNVIDGVVGGGIVMGEESSAGQISIENNQLRSLGRRNDRELSVAAIRLLRADQGEVVSNSIDGFAQTSIQSPRRVGIEVLASVSVRIAGNDLVDIGPSSGFAGIGAGIAVEMPLERTDVLDNSVRRSRAASPEDASDWRGVRIGTLQGFFNVDAIFRPVGLASTGGGTFGFFPATGKEAESNTLFIGTRLISVLPRGAETVGARGNVVDAYGRSAAIDVTTSGPCVVGDNRCSLRASSADSAVVAVAAGAAVVGNNYAERVPSHDAAAAIRVSVGHGPFTILGNVCRGGVILVDGANLSNPWAPLNATSF